MQQDRQPGADAAHRTADENEAPGATPPETEQRPLPPHPTLPEHYEEPGQRPRFVRDLFDATAEHYDWINRVLSFGTGRRHRAYELRHAAIEPGMRVLDVGTGTGELAELAQERVGSAGHVIGLDPSAGMLRCFRASRGDRVQAAAERLPIADGSVDRITMGYALRHVADLHAMFSEFFRVLRPGGRVLVLEIRCPEAGWRRSLLKLYLKHLGPALARLRGRDLWQLMRFYWDTIERCVPPDSIIHAMRAAGFAEAQSQTTGGVFAAYVAVKR